MLILAFEENSALSCQNGLFSAFYLIVCNRIWPGPSIFFHTEKLQQQVFRKIYINLKVMWDPPIMEIVIVFFLKKVILYIFAKNLFFLNYWMHKACMQIGVNGSNEPNLNFTKRKFQRLFDVFVICEKRMKNITKNFLMAFFPSQTT